MDKQVQINPRTGKPKRPPRTIKEKKFAKAYMENGGNKCQAVFSSYDVKPGDYNSATKIANELSQKLTIVEMMETVEGLRPVDRLKCLAEGLYANKQISGIGDANGKSVEFVEVPDYANRYKYLELSFKLDGSLSKQDEGNTQNFFQFIQNQKNNYGNNGDTV